MKLENVLGGGVGMGYNQVSKNQKHFCLVCSTVSVVEFCKRIGKGSLHCFLFHVVCKEWIT